VLNGTCSKRAYWELYNYAIVYAEPKEKSIHLRLITIQEKEVCTLGEIDGFSESDELSESGEHEINTLCSKNNDEIIGWKNPIYSKNVLQAKDKDICVNSTRQSLSEEDLMKKAKQNYGNIEKDAFRILFNILDLGAPSGLPEIIFDEALNKKNGDVIISDAGVEFLPISRGDHLK